MLIKCLFFVCMIAVSHIHVAQHIPSKLLKYVNSPHDEQQPSISPDGNTLYFTIANHSKNIGGRVDKGDIWFSRWINESWSSPTHAGEQLNNTGYNAVGGISHDGLRLYLFGHYNLLGRSKTQSIHMSHRTNSGWSTPQPITIPYFPTQSSMLSGYVSPNERIILFAVKSYHTLGAEDIYVSKRGASGKWGEPINLGEPINSPYQEFSPWLTSDTKYLYFASNRHAGYGSFDIYYSKRADDTWTNWSTPINIGEAINSEGRELFYSISPKGDAVLYTTTRNSDGYGDIRKTDIPEHAIDSLTRDSLESKTKMIAPKNASNDGLTKICGKVMEIGTTKMIVATLYFYSDSAFQSISTPDGYFSIDLPSSYTYRVEVKASGYLNYFGQIDVHEPVTTHEVDFYLYPIRIGTTVVLDNVLFQRGTATLLDESSVALDRVVSFMMGNQSVEILLAGHTDNQGVHKHNLKLSQKRVERVKEYLVNKGIERKRLTGKGYGGVKPIASNQEEPNRKFNRRVEFTIIKK